MLLDFTVQFGKDWALQTRYESSTESSTRWKASWCKNAFLKHVVSQVVRSPVFFKLDSPWAAIMIVMMEPGRFENW